MEISTTIKPTLQAMKVGDEKFFPLSKRRSVRTIASDLKTDFGLVFKTEKRDNLIIVKRNK